MNLALIGCGGLGRVHAGCVKRIGPAKARIVAFCDLVESAAQKMCADFGGDYATTSAERIFSDPRIDAVYICTRHDSHAALAIAAANAGKHILIEKPLALNMDDCQKIAGAVRNSGVHLMPAFKLRYYPLVQKARAFIPEPQVIVGQMMDSRWPDDHWAQDPFQGGGNVHSQGCHTTDLLRYFSGREPERLWATGGAMTHPNHPCIDQCIATIRFANGAGGCVGSWIQGDAACGAFTGKFFFELFGDGKSVQLYDRLKKATFSDGNKTWTEERPEEEGFYLENVEFISALLENRAPALNVEDGIQATKMVLAADRAIRTGKVQDLS